MSYNCSMYRNFTLYCYNKNNKQDYLYVHYNDEQDKFKFNNENFIKNFDYVKCIEEFTEKIKKDFSEYIQIEEKNNELINYLHDIKEALIKQNKKDFNSERNNAIKLIDSYFNWIDDTYGDDKIIISNEVYDIKRDEIKKIVENIKLEYQI